MKRYSIDFYGEKMVEDKDGEYVKYDEAQKIREAYYDAWENAVVSGLLESELRDDLSAMTALAEKYRGQRDELIEVLQMAIDVTDEKQYPETQGIMIRAILKIQEEDK